MNIVGFDLEEIGDICFSRWKILKYVYFPNLEIVGVEAFLECRNLFKVYCNRLKIIKK